MEVKIGAGREDEVILVPEFRRSPSITATRLHFGRVRVCLLLYMTGSVVAGKPFCPSKSLRSLLCRGLVLQLHVALT